MKKLLQKWMCRLFGHQVFEELFAAKRCSLRTNNRTPLYDVVREVRCDRCGESKQQIIRSGIRRSQLLKEGWFIER